MSEHLEDARARERIRTDTHATFFVDAGAGSGKTTALVDRVSSLVLNDGIRLNRIAAVTFTEKAGAELRDKLRAQFERRWRAASSDGDDDARAAAAQALDDLDGAAIGTLHSFAQRILTEHPIEAGLPPIIDVLDEVGSSVAFEERWSQMRAALLDDDDVAEALLHGLALGMKLEHIRSLAVSLGREWDRIGERILASPPPRISIPDLDGFAERAADFAAKADHCTDAGDTLLPYLDAVREKADLLRAAPDTSSRLAVLAGFSAVKFGGKGRKGNWSVAVADVREDGNALAAEAKQLLDTVLDQCLRQVTAWLAGQVLDAAEARRRDGRLEFHDLLVLSRDLLRRDAGVRAALHEDYQRLLLDEFQDTDPIQIELATRICGGADADAANWQDIAVPDGQLFVVGDAKQSIYRFRRADIATYLKAQAHIGERLGLTTNFRTVAPVLDWVNAVFGTLITFHDDAQPAYERLAVHRDDAGAGPAAGPAVTVLGATGHTDKTNAAILREREAADVAAVIRQALEERWQVLDERTGVWRDARCDDIAVLVPARTSLPYLEDALDGAQIPYRAEASSLVYQTAEVRALLACARAVADTSDALALVTALRSPLFGCGDDDLWNWKQAGGRFNIYSELSADDPLATGPVGSALTYLRRLSFEARWLAPSEVLGAIVADRRMFEVAATGPRARDAWRRLRFVVDQSRAWSEVSHGGLRAYLAWAAHQAQELTRVAEAVLPETDADSVRVMTIHAAKGLEFPIVILSGMTAQGRPRGGVGVAFPSAGGYQVRLTKSLQTGDFAATVPIDEQMDDLEKLRLLYVAATRARDHLVVSLHRAEGSKADSAARRVAEAGGLSAGATAFAGYAPPLQATAAPPASPPPEYAAWLAGVEAARDRSRVAAAISASGLEGTEPELVLAPQAGPDDPPPDAAAGLAKGSRDLDLPPWSKGRYGSAIGRAVHAVLQAVDLATGDGLDDAVAAQSVAEGVVGHEDLVRDLARSALDSDLVKHAARHEYWRETYVGTTIADGTVLEGYVDLVYRDDDGTLVIVDYKTDAVPAGAIDSRVTYYRPQLAAYREALAAATGASVRSTLLFLNPQASAAVPCD